MEILHEYNNFWLYSALRTLTDPAKDTTPAYGSTHWERRTGQEDVKAAYS
jgi:hypothetical protein